MKRSTLARDAAGKFFRDNVTMLELGTTTVEANAQLLAAVHEFASTNRFGDDAVWTAPWINFGAPIVYKQSERKLIAEIAGLCLNRATLSHIGLMCSPESSPKAVQLGN